MLQEFNLDKNSKQDSFDFVKVLFKTPRISKRDNDIIYITLQDYEIEQYKMFLKSQD